jgi:hypothetical protein
MDPIMGAARWAPFLPVAVGLIVGILCDAYAKPRPWYFLGLLVVATAAGFVRRIRARAAIVMVLTASGTNVDRSISVAVRIAVVVDLDVGYVNMIGGSAAKMPKAGRNQAMIGALLEKRADATALGFRVKSGWAAAVLLECTADSPRALDRCVVELSDPENPETRQPYHAGTGREETNAARIRRRIQAVERVANRATKALLARYQEFNAPPRVAGLVVGSLIEPEIITNPHIRAHAHEGKLFRTVLVDALTKSGLYCQVLIEKRAYAQAAAVTGRSEADLKKALTAMGSSVGRPWGANEKLAALAAWYALAAVNKR